MCNAANGTTVTCDCNSRFFFNTVTQRIPLQTSACACFQQPSNATNSTLRPVNGTNATSNVTTPAPRSTCTCCTGEGDLVRPVRACQAGFESLVKCDQCFNVTNGTRRAYQCNCAGINLLDNRSPAQMQSLDISNQTCSCINFGNRSTCDCCVSNNIWNAARPVCSANQTSERCNCRNVTTVTRMNTTSVQRVNQTTSFACRPTGCSREICANVLRGNISTSCRWNNTFACF